jgi:hypothetical protein
MWENTDGEACLSDGPVKWELLRRRKKKKKIMVHNPTDIHTQGKGRFE